MTEPRKQTIVSFIRRTLGCQCPDDVFRSIALTPGKIVDGLRYNRVGVGNRLLVTDTPEP